MKEDLSIKGRGLVVDDGRIGDWMQTYTGRRFYPLDPRAEDVDILDIAFALGNLSRYGGHCRFYSVAEHSVMVSRLVRPELALEGLLHDATEAYVVDLIRPMKRALGPENDYFKIDAAVRLAIAERFGLQPTEPEEVKLADVAVLRIEKDVLHPRSQEWDIPKDSPQGVQIRCLQPPVSQKFFLRRFSEISHISTYPLLERMDHILNVDDQVLQQHWGS